MIRSREGLVRDTSYKWYESERAFTPNAEAKICLTCDLPTCGQHSKCERYEQKRKELKELKNATKVKRK
jgi:hypothetical protein